MNDKFIHFERTILEEFFLTLSHSSELENITMKDLRTISRRLIKNVPLSALVLSDKIDIGEEYYGDKEANDNENYGGRKVGDSFSRKKFK